MIQIYAPENTNFEMNGNDVLAPSTCTMEAELGGAWSLSMTHPIDDEGKWKNIVKEAVISAPTFMGKKQLFRIEESDKQDAEIIVKAYPIFFDSADEVFLMDKRPTGKNGQEALDILTEGTKYRGESNISAVNTAYFIRRNLMNALNGDSPSFIDTWGGEPLYDNFKVIINERAGGDYGAEVRYGKNMDGISFREDMSEVVTRIVPVAFNGRTLSTSYVDSPLISKYAKVYTREIVFEDVKYCEDITTSEDTSNLIVCNSQEELDAALIAKCNEQFEAGIDIYKITIDVDMVSLESTEEYKNFTDLVRIGLGDTVGCYNNRLGITTKARAIKIKWDCITDSVIEVVLGDYEYNILDQWNSTISKIENIVNNDGTVAAEKIQGILNAINVQLRYQNSAAQKQEVRAILFEDLDLDSPLYGALAIGTQGLQISNKRTADGRDWEWTTAFTANGGYADVIIAGILADKTGKNSWNLETGEFLIDKLKLYSSKEELNSAITQSAESITAAVNKNIEETANNIQAQIDDAIETFTGDNVPTLTNEPAVGWSTNTEKDKHIGDLYIVNSDNESHGGFYYRFEKKSNSYQWVLLKDTEITKALQDAKEANDKANAVADDLAANYSKTTQMNSAIEQKANSILSSVNVQIQETKDYADDAAEDAKTSANATTTEKLKNYSTTTEMNSAINQKADSITSTVSKQITETRTYADTVANSAKDSANAQTIEKLKSYSTTTEMNTAIQQNADSITSTVAKSQDTWIIDIESYSIDIYGYGNPANAMAAENKGKTYLDMETGFVYQTITNGEGQIVWTIVGECQKRSDDIYSKIQQNAYGISQKVSNGEVVSEINQSADTIELKGDRIIIESEKWKVSENGSQECSDLTITGGEINIDNGSNYEEYNIKIAASSAQYYTKVGATGVMTIMDDIYTEMSPSSFSLGNYYGNSYEQIGYIGREYANLQNTNIIGKTLSISGTKSRIASTKNYRDRLLYCYETPSPMFGDLGEGKIDETGKCYIFLDDIFGETIDTDCVYQVFLQPYGKGDCYVIERTSSYFIVEGTENLAFGWELKAIQRDFDTMRLEEYEENTTEETNVLSETYGYLTTLLYDPETEVIENE